MADMTQARAGVYGRQSSGKAKSIAEQIDAGKAAAAAEGWIVVGCYQDGSSASRYARKQRDDWQRVLADIDAGKLDVLVLWESSRGDRTPETWFALLSSCRERHVRIHIVSHERTYNLSNVRDWKVLAEDGVTSAYESDLLSVRVRRGQGGAAAAGRPGHGRTPYGYVRVYDPRTGALVGQEPDPVTAPIVRQIIDQAAKGVPISAITDHLNATGAPTVGAVRWYRVRVRDVATNPAYIGVRQYNGTEHVGEWEPLVDKATFYAAQRVLSDPARVTTRPGRQKHLLSYLGTCGPCGGPLVAVRGRYRCLRPGCVTIVQEPTDDLVTQVIVARLSMPDVYQALRQAGDDADKELLAARGEAATLRARLDEWRRSAAKGATTPETLAVIEAELSAEIKAADRRAQRAEIPPALRQILKPGEDVATRWAAAPLPARRDLIRAYMSVQILPASSPRSRTFEPERIDIRWR